MTNETAKPTVVVAGGGYAGLLAANRLVGRLGGSARVVLVTLGDKLTDRIRLHEAAARGKDVQHALSRLLHRNVERIDARVVGVDPAARTITLLRAGEEQDMQFDWLVMALGSRFASSVPADGQHAFALADQQAALALWRTLRGLQDGGRVAIVGGGLTAVELASEIAEAHPRLSVELLTSELAPGLRGAAQQQLQTAVEKTGVTLRIGQRVRALTHDAVVLADGERIACDVGVLCSGFAPAALGARFLLPTDEHGRIPVDAQLRVAGHERVFAVGDLAAPPEGTIGLGAATTRMGCATAMPQGAHAADQIARAIQGRTLQPYHFSYVVQCISVGRNQGVVAQVSSDDRPTGRVWSGRSGAVMKELVCRFVLGGIRLERLFGGLYAWPGRRATLRLPAPAAQRLPG